MYLSNFFFSYKYILRFLLINKISFINNTYFIPKINKIIFYFFFKNLENYNNIQIYNSFYMFKFFFGRKAFLSKNNTFFLLGKWYYNLDIKLILNKEKEIFFLLYFYINNILIKIEKSNINLGFLNKKYNIYYFLLKDVHIFSELKTNLGLFNLKNFLYLNIYITGCDSFKNSNIFIDSLKMKIFL